MRGREVVTRLGLTGLETMLKLSFTLHGRDDEPHVKISVVHQQANASKQ